MSRTWSDVTNFLNEECRLDDQFLENITKNIDQMTCSDKASLILSLHLFFPYDFDKIAINAYLDKVYVCSPDQNPELAAQEIIEELKMKKALLPIIIHMAETVRDTLEVMQIAKKFYAE